jgi:flagellar basal-body rod protein FlgG
MLRALYSSATGMQAQETNIDVISNNIANVNTTGYKRSRAEFQDLIYQQVIEPGAPTSQQTQNPSGIQVGLGVRTVAVQKIFAQGDLINTDNPLDIAIQGDGFLQVLKPDGTLSYTRAGALQRDVQGNLVTPEGYRIAPGITIPPDVLSVTIGEDGTVSVRQPGGGAPAQVGQIAAVRFANPAGLRALGKNLFEETASSGAPLVGIFANQGFGSLQQGFVEGSNVSVVEQIVNMITAQRAYEANSKSIQTADDMLSQAINLKR